MTPTTIILAVAAMGVLAWALGHYGTSTLFGKARAAEHEVAEKTADAATSAIKWLTDKSRQQAIITKAQADMERMDALLAHVQAQLPKS